MIAGGDHTIMKIFPPYEGVSETIGAPVGASHDWPTNVTVSAVLRSDGQYRSSGVTGGLEGLPYKIIVFVGEAFQASRQRYDI